MIRQRPGDLLEIKVDGKYFYVVVLTKIVQFGGNIVFAFHGDGSKHRQANLQPSSSGFNVCVDLLWEKREDNVRRIDRLSDCSGFWRTEFVKASNMIVPGVKIPLWFVHRIDDPDMVQTRYKKLPKKLHSAMDSGTYPFEHLIEKILTGYTPDQNRFLLD